MTPPIRLTIWNEYRHERRNPRVAELYPEGIHGALARYLRARPALEVSTATLDTDADHGLSEERLNNTDVLTWWGHLHHDEVSDAVVKRVHDRILAGMGLVALHSAHYSKLFKRLMGTTCELKWRDTGEREILWATKPGHPILDGVDDHFVVDREEMYGEYFDIPQPDETLLISSFAGGEVFRSCCTFTRGAGRIVYFRPGHETFPTYYDKNVLRVIENSIRWAAPTRPVEPLTFGNKAAGWIQ
jgi:trehalose utilization protein